MCVMIFIFLSLGIILSPTNELWIFGYFKKEATDLILN